MSPLRRKRAAEDFFDLGDECDDAWESVGEYDCGDSFIDDGASSGVEGEPDLRGRKRARRVSLSERTQHSVSVATRQHSPLFEPECSAHAEATSVVSNKVPPATTATWPPEGSKEPTRRMGKDGKKSGAFRCNSKRLLLTFAKSGEQWSHHALVDDLEKLGAKFRLGRELHKDGTPHYHCYVDFGRNYQFEGCHRFCYGPNGDQTARTCSGTGHCNILVVYKTPHFVWDYPGKDGAESILIDTTDGRPHVSTSKADRVAEGLYCFDASSRSQFFARIKEVDPWAFIKSHSQVVGCGDFLFPEKPITSEWVNGLTFRWESFPECTKWVLASLPDGADRIRRIAPSFSTADEQRLVSQLPPRLVGGRPKSLILWGESLHGKTDFATHLGEHVHWMRDFRLRDLFEKGIENIEYLIIDDINWDSTLLNGSAYKSWLGGMMSFVATDKFDRKLRIAPWGKPCIFLCNDNPLDFVSASTARFLEKNCYIEEVVEGNYVTRHPDVFV